jgi:hypothetical protein
MFWLLQGAWDWRAKKFEALPLGGSGDRDQVKPGRVVAGGAYVVRVRVARWPRRLGKLWEGSCSVVVLVAALWSAPWDRWAAGQGASRGSDGP